MYLSLVVLIPLAALFLKAAGVSFAQWLKILGSERVLAAAKLTFGTGFVAALVGTILGLPVAWVLVRYQFPGKKVLDAMVDIPFALPTAVAGITLTQIYAKNGWLGAWLEGLGIKVAYTPVGVTVALIFIGMPFIIRTVQPVLEEIGTDIEEAAATLGAGRWTTVRRTVLPLLVPSMLTGFALAFARGIGEYGSVVFISGNLPMKTEILPLLIVSKLEQYRVKDAAVLASGMLIISFILLFLINLLQRKLDWRKNR